ncbi:MAG: SH3-like domain-containing protein [Haloferacaceae archaeon]
MNGVHDMGGMHGFGDVPDDDARFHADWERTAYALNKVLRLQGAYNIHEYRHSVERMEPAAYLGASYFERWLGGVERLLGEKGVLTEAEIEARLEAIQAGEYEGEGASLVSGDGTTGEAVDTAAGDDPNADLARRVRESFRTGATEGRSGATEDALPGDAPDAAFDVGDAVRVRNRHPAGHTRVPRYARGATGTVTKRLGTFELPDPRAAGEQSREEPVYAVRFDAAELWGPDTDGDEVQLDMWESYLDPA